jgi:hypothetical protein
MSRAGGSAVVFLLAFFMISHGSSQVPAGVLYDNDEAFALQAGLLPPRNVDIDNRVYWEGLSRAYALEGRLAPGGIASWLDIPEDKRVIIVAIQAFGLANRLRVLASAFFAAQDSGRLLVIDWSPDTACGASLTDLFKPPIDWPAEIQSQVSLYSGDSRLLRGLAGHVNWSVPVVNVKVHPRVSNESILVWRPRGTVLPSARLLQQATKVVVMRPGSIFVPHGGSCQEHYHRKRLFYRALLTSLSSDVSAWLQTISQHSLVRTGRFLSQRLLIGIHVRVHDQAHDWPVVAPQPTKPDSTGAASESDDSALVQEAQTFDAVAPLQMFADAMTALISHIPTVHFFVASNSESAKGKLVEVFGKERVSSINNSAFSNRSSAVGVKRALVDFVLLSQSVLVVHGYGSSFGEEAAAVNLSPALRLRIGGHVYGVDVSFPFCNNAVFENGYNAAQRSWAKFAGTSSTSLNVPDKSTEEVCYRDASFEGERDRICTATAQRSPCLFFQRGWGIPGVYC